MLLAAPFLTLASALAPQHIHEPDGHTHGHAVAHSHFAPHEFDHHHDDLEIEHDEARRGQVVWANSPILHKATHRAASIAPAIPITYASVLAELRWSVTLFDDIAPAHGPPRSAHRLRGPPLPRLS